jgi:hypothetical protein
MIRTAAILSFVIGAMSIAAGGKAIQGWNPGWNVVAWLPVYNFLMGVLTVAVPTVLIWKNHQYAMIASLMTLAIHGIVALLLLTVFRSMVATQSILAMASRFITWLVIIALLYFSKR